jgi:diacylglycerol kinase (ATP)
MAAGLCDYRYPPVSVTIVETGERLVGSLVMVFNLPQYALGLPIAPRAKADDGLLDLYVFQPRGAVGLFRTVSTIIRRRHESQPIVQHRLVQRIHLSATQTVPLQTDGDQAGYLPTTIEVVPAALRLLVPP